MLPLLKYPGGKRKLIGIIREAFESACTGKEFNLRPLDERFFGSGAVSFGLESAEVFANDICLPVIAFHRQVVKGLSLKGIDFTNTEENYLRNRCRFNRLLEQGNIQCNEAAGLLYFLNRTAFNGLVRFSNKSGFNVDFASYSKIEYKTDFNPWQAISTNWAFSNSDFEAPPVCEESAVFIDSPYDSIPKTEDSQISLFDPFDIENIHLASASRGSGFVAYNGDLFGWGDQLRVVRFALSIPNPVVITNLATPRIVALYERYGFTIKTHSVGRSISRNGDGRKKVQEVIAIKKEAKP